MEQMLIMSSKVNIIKLMERMSISANPAESTKQPNARTFGDKEEMILNSARKMEFKMH